MGFPLKWIAAAHILFLRSYIVAIAQSSCMIERVLEAKMSIGHSVLILTAMIIGCTLLAHQLLSSTGGPSLLRYDEQTQLTKKAFRTVDDFHRHTLEEESIPSSQSCLDPIWCNVPMPKESLFRFPTPPNDAARWSQAQRLAASGDPVLLRRIKSFFPHYFDFLDGDTQFRAYHMPTDYFMDDNHGFEVLSRDYPGASYKPQASVLGGKLRKYNWESDPYNRVIPKPYDIRNLERAPVIHLGYFGFNRKGSSSASNFFGGNFVGEAIVDRGKLIKLWNAGKDHIDRSWIGLHSANENWGMFSTLFPNRTTNWGSCCDKNRPEGKKIYEILDHPKTLMLLTNQHHNITHPKLITLPRGLPIHGDHSRRVVWDMMHELSSYASKKRLVFTASSNWGYRPKLLECLAHKFDPKEATFNLHQDRNLKGRLTPQDYYDKLGTSKFCIALPGLGYDTYRLWESMTIGTIPILERGVGFDKSLWRLPALLVEDFDFVTPDLLHMAYVEALYRVEEFEFERLKQSFWWTFLMNVSRAMSQDAISAKFPPEAEDPTFARPLERFSCHETNSCGAGTKRIPRRMC